MPPLKKSAASTSPPCFVNRLPAGGQEFLTRQTGPGALSVDYGKIPGGEFEAGNLTLQAMDAAAIGHEFAPSGHPLAFHVDDVAATRAELESKGVEFVGETIDSGVCHMASFRDPDGNAFLLHHRYAPRT